MDFSKWGIFIHHTASSGNPYGVMDYWVHNHNKVSTPFLIARGDGHEGDKHWHDGQIFQLYPSIKGQWHLGLSLRHLRVGGPKHKSNVEMNLHTVPIELCAWGYLVEKDQKFITYDGTVIEDKDICELSEPYRGFKHYHRYSDAQLDSLRDLLRFLCEHYNIPKWWAGPSMFEISPECLQGKPGIWTHTSCRPKGEKWDCYPDPRLISMLNSL